MRKGRKRKRRSRRRRKPRRRSKNKKQKTPRIHRLRGSSLRFAMMKIAAELELEPRSERRARLVSSIGLLAVTALPARRLVHLLF
jgi:hypothetical protein